MEKKVIYYKDELNDEFAGDSIQPKVIDGNWVYIHTSLWKKFTRFFWLRIVFTPIAWSFLKFKYHWKVENKNALKYVKKQAFFMFGNHTHNICDAFIPPIMHSPRNIYLIVNANNVSMPVLGKLTPSLGAIPLPANLAATKNFLKCIETRVNQKCGIIIYPEAHIWPFYTKIRPFPDTSFRYPVQYDTPVLCFTNTYQKRKFSKNPKIVTYIDGPFYPDKNLDKNSRKKDLRDKCYNAMCQRSKNSNLEIIQYIKAEQDENSENLNSAKGV